MLHFLQINESKTYDSFQDYEFITSYKHRISLISDSKPVALQLS